MSLKPPKKSDLGKSWMKNRRDKARMIQPEYHLIASEGTETEPQYFGAIQRIINSKYRDRIQLKVEGVGDNTVNLLMKARQYVQNNGIVFIAHKNCLLLFFLRMALQEKTSKLFAAIEHFCQTI